MLVLLWGLSIGFLAHPHFTDDLSKLWVCVLFVQSVPYAAAVLFSFINVLPALFGRDTSEQEPLASPAE